MNTTVIFAELLIIGIQAVVWVSLFCAALFGEGWVHPCVRLFRIHPFLSVLVFVTLSYTLGLLVDATTLVLSRIIKPKNILLRVSWIKRMVIKTDIDQRMLVMAQEEQAAPFLAYLRSRLRVLRGTCFNLFLGAVAWFLVVCIRGGFHGYYPSWRISSAICGLALVIAIYCFVLAGMIGVSHDNRLAQALSKDEHGHKNGEANRQISK